MKSTRWTGRSVSTLGIAVLAVFTVACTDDRALPPTSAEITQTRLSGEEIFRGVFFGEGEAGARLSRMWGHTPASTRLSEDPTVVLQGISNLTSRIRAQDPDFLDRFGAVMQSGNHVAIAAALDEAVTQLQSMVANATTQDEFIDDPSFKYVYRMVAVVNYALVYRYAVALEAALLAVDADAAMLFRDDRSELARDMIVDEIARKLRVS